MKKTTIQLKWKAINPKQNGFAEVLTLDNVSVCTVWGGGGGFETAKQIVSDHNEQLKVNKALAKTPFKK